MTQQKEQKLMNVPNVLSLVRMVMVPLCIAAILYMPALCGGIQNPTLRLWLVCLVPTLIFALTALTDMLDGKIARKYGLITDFGKFIDPLADKFMVFGILIAILSAPLYAEIRPVFVWVTAIVMLRELGVTSLRLVVASRGVVVPASWWGKVKTVTQIVALVLILMEPALLQHLPYNPAESFNLLVDGHLIAWLAMAGIAVTTVGSGLDYLKSLWPYVTGKR
ncbi:MAG: CDP-diacylglycerol--glycerol-3-phosphate 3-phosphatidyltransferase [Clostridia bacterium]|nr:CDP-diacylglycerol--glycerol-3-phosphate 3-phosphatidyltransferase [Clostridia bacterium]